MSRIGKRVLTIPEKVNVELVNDILTVKGPKGELTLSGSWLPPQYTTFIGEIDLILFITGIEKAEGTFSLSKRSPAIATICTFSLTAKSIIFSNVIRVS